jgi:hypothetical protein
VPTVVGKVARSVGGRRRRAKKKKTVEHIKIHTDSKQTNKEKNTHTDTVV